MFDFIHGNALKRTADFRIIKQNPENGRNFPGIQEMEKCRKIQINAKMVSWKEEEKT